MGADPAFVPAASSRSVSTEGFNRGELKRVAALFPMENQLLHDWANACMASPIEEAPNYVRYMASWAARELLAGDMDEDDALTILRRLKGANQ